MPVEAGRLVEAVHIACGGLPRFVQGGEVVSLFIPGCGIIMGDFLAGLYSKLSAGAIVIACAERYKSLKHIVDVFACLNLLSHAKTQKRKDFKTIAHLRLLICRLG